MVDRDAHLGEKTINKHKENIIINIKKVATFGGRKSTVIGLGHFHRIPQWQEKLYDVGSGVHGCLKNNPVRSMFLLSGFLYLYFILQ